MPPPVDRPRKRSVTIGGHATSFTLEDAFWTALRDDAARRGVSLASLVSRIDRDRSTDTNLSSALRLHVLGSLLERIEMLERDGTGG